MQRENTHALTFAGIAALAVILYSSYFYEGAQWWYRFWYYTPAAATAGAWCFGRIRERDLSRWVWLFDIIVLSIAICRPIWGIPAVSGHALFAVYALMTSRNRVTDCLAALLLGITVYAKLILWQGDFTLWTGLVLGFILGGFRCRATKLP